MFFSVLRRAATLRSPLPPFIAGTIAGHTNQSEDIIYFVLCIDSIMVIA